MPCYKLEALVIDETGTTLFIFFPNAAEQLVDIPLSSLQLREPSIRRQLPPHIRFLIDNRWELQVLVNFKSYTTSFLVFNVVRVIKQLQRVLALPPPPEEKPFQPLLSDTKGLLPKMALPPPPENSSEILLSNKKGKRPMTTEELEGERKLAKHGMPTPRQINLQPLSLREKR